MCLHALSSLLRLAMSAVSWLGLRALLHFPGCVNRIGTRRAVLPGMGLLRAVLELCWEIWCSQMQPGPGLWAALWDLLFWWHKSCNARGQSSWIRWITVGAMGWFTQVSNAAVDSVSSFIGKKAVYKINCFGHKNLVDSNALSPVLGVLIED